MHTNTNSQQVRQKDIQEYLSKRGEVIKTIPHPYRSAHTINVLYLRLVPQVANLEFLLGNQCPYLIYNWVVKNKDGIIVGLNGDQLDLSEYWDRFDKDQVASEVFEQIGVDQWAEQWEEIIKISVKEKQVQTK